MLELEYILFNKVSEDLLFTQVTDLEIFQFFIKRETGVLLEPGEISISPFRIGNVLENNPSFGIYFADKLINHSHLSIFFKDLRLSDHCGDIYVFLKKLYGFKYNSEVVEFVFKEMCLKNTTLSDQPRHLKPVYKKPSKVIVPNNITPTKEFKDYFNSIHISEETLKRYYTTQINNYDLYEGDRFIKNVDIPGVCANYRVVR